MGEIQTPLKVVSSSSSSRLSMGKELVVLEEEEMIQCEVGEKEDI